MTPIRSIIPALAALIGLSCVAPSIPIVHETVPVQKSNTELLPGGRLAMIRSVDLDISAQSVSDSIWEKVAAQKCIYRKRYHGTAPQLPYELIILTIHNTNEYAVSDIHSEIIIKEKTFAAVTAKEAESRYARSVFGILDFYAMLTPRRLIPLEFDPEKFNLDDDTITYPFDFILPLDRVAVLCAYETLPVEERTFTLRLNYTIHGAKKSIDFNFARIENRADQRQE